MINTTRCLVLHLHRKVALNVQRVKTAVVLYWSPTGHANAMTDIKSKYGNNHRRHTLTRMNSSENCAPSIVGSWLQMLEICRNNG